MSNNLFIRRSSDAAGFRSSFVLVAIRRDLIFSLYSCLSITTVDRPLSAGTTTIESSSLMLFNAQGWRFLSGGLAPWRIPTRDVLALCTASLLDGSTFRRPSSTAAMICGIGIFFRAGAKFRPLARCED